MGALRDYGGRTPFSIGREVDGSRWGEEAAENVASSENLAYVIYTSVDREAERIAIEHRSDEVLQ